MLQFDFHVRQIDRGKSYLPLQLGWSFLCLPKIPSLCSPTSQTMFMLFLIASLPHYKFRPHHFLDVPPLSELTIWDHYNFSIWFSYIIQSNYLGISLLDFTVPHFLLTTADKIQVPINFKLLYIFITAHVFQHNQDI